MKRIGRTGRQRAVGKGRPLHRVRVLNIKNSAFTVRANIFRLFVTILRLT